MIKSVLVGVDGSVNSYKALDFALEFAERFGASLTIINVSESLAMTAVPQEATGYQNGSTAVFAKDLRAIQNEIIAKSVQRAKATRPNVTVSYLQKEGDAAFEIINVAREEGFDVVVVGHRGAGGMRERLLGTISEKVAHQAPCTVVIAK